METLALTGITTHSGYRYWWVGLIFWAALGIIWGASKVRAVIVERRFNARLAAPKPTPRVELVIGDITAEWVDAIVNAAKPSLMGGGGVDGAIHKAGGRAILDECYELRASDYPRGLPIGEAVATTAGHLHAGHVIHTVGPVYSADEDRSELLRSCYARALAVADQLGARSVAFPLISAGVYGWPKQDAIIQAFAGVALAETSVETVRFVFYDEATYLLAQHVRDSFLDGA